MKCEISVLLRRFLVVSLALVVMCSAALKPAAAAEPIKLGVVFSITGWGGFIGSPMKDAAIAVVEDVNKKGGVLGRPIELLIEDDQSNPTNAVVAATKLIKDQKVAAIIGPSITDSGRAIIPLCEQEQVPFCRDRPGCIVSEEVGLPSWPGGLSGRGTYPRYSRKRVGSVEHHQHLHRPEEGPHLRRRYHG